jgi:hypothetical protein
LRLCHAIRDAGAAVKLHDGQVVIGAASRLSPELLDRAKREKDLLTKELKQEAAWITEILARCASEPANVSAATIASAVRDWQAGEIDRREVLRRCARPVDAICGRLGTDLEGEALLSMVSTVFPAAHTLPAAEPIGRLFGPKPNANAFAPAPPEQGSML